MFKKRAVSTVTTLVPALGFALAIGGCNVPNPDVEQIDVNPLTQDEAAQSLQRINERPGDPEAQSALQQIRPALDRLNGLIARVEPEPGRVISFYELSPGEVLVSEKGPMDGRRLLPLTGMDAKAVSDLYRRLAGAEPPAALVAAEERARMTTETDDVGPVSGGQVSATSPVGPTANGATETVTSSLTEADGAWFRNNGCFAQGPGEADAAGCLPNWWNGGYAQSSTKTSFFTVATFSGDVVNVRMQYSGSTKFQDPVFLGEWLSWWYHSSTYNTVNGRQYNMRTHRWDILQAGGKGFHWSYAFKWNCSGTFACDGWPSQ